MTGVYMKSDIGMKWVKGQFVDQNDFMHRKMETLKERSVSYNSNGTKYSRMDQVKFVKDSL